MEQDTKKFLDKTFILASVLVLGVLVFFVGEMVVQNKSVSLQNQNQITVSGEGKVYAKPDIATVSFGVTTQAVTVADVTKSNTTKMNAVISAIKKLGVDEKDIQTTNYNLAPQYNWTEKSGQVFTGYTLDQDVLVKIRDFTKVGDILSAGTANGANLVGSLQFTIDNPEALKDQARAKAISVAKTNAENLAKESGVKLGKIINVMENNYATPSPIMYNSAKAMGAGVMDSVVSPTVQAGQQEIDITVNLTYQVR